jgi:hypothetical protein
VSARLRFVLGLALVLVAWPANWFLPGLRTHVLFFPLWLGAILLLDGHLALARGSSPCARSPRGFVRLFLVSLPLWWLFELANARLGNWEYVGRERFSDLEYALFGSLSFSTVVPAVLLCAEWARGARWIERCARGPRLSDSPRLRALLFVLGSAQLAAWIAWPRTCYPLVWTSGVFLLEPLLLARGRRGLVSDLARGDWRPWMALWAGGLLCGFFWELWNVRSYPRWIYHVPGFDEPKLFEMPLPGYLGYLPFALVVYQWKELWLDEPELLREVGGR